MSITLPKGIYSGSEVSPGAAVSSGHVSFPLNLVEFKMSSTENGVLWICGSLDAAGCMLLESQLSCSVSAD